MGGWWGPLHYRDSQSKLRLSQFGFVFLELWGIFKSEQDYFRHWQYDKVCSENNEVYALSIPGICLFLVCFKTTLEQIEDRFKITWAEREPWESCERAIREGHEGELWGRAMRELWERAVRESYEGAVRESYEREPWGSREGESWGRVVGENCEGELWGRAMREQWERAVRESCEGELWELWERAAPQSSQPREIS